MSNCTIERQMVIALVVQCGIAAMSPDLTSLGHEVGPHVGNALSAQEGRQFLAEGKKRSIILLRQATRAIEEEVTLQRSRGASLRVPATS